MIDCPGCGAVVLPENVVDGVAQCGACEHLFELSAHAVATAEAEAEAVRPVRPDALPKPERRPLVLPSAPSGASLTTHDEGLEIALSWRKDVGVLGHMLQVALAWFFLYLGFQEVSVMATAITTAVAIVLLYGWLYTLMNRTTVLVAPGGVEISHGPLPSFSFGASYRPAQLRPLSVETVVKGFGRSRRTVYELHTASAGTVLLGNWNHREPLAFVRDCIEAVHDPRASAVRQDSFGG